MIERVPIIKIGDYLLTTVQVEMHDRMALALQHELTQRVSDTNAKGVIIDISCVDMLDSFMGRMLSMIASMTKILDAETVVVGMQPAVAITLVEMGVTLPDVLTALDVEKGMQLLDERTHSHRELEHGHRH